MEQYQYDFVEFLIKQKSLIFGEFKLRSNRISPYYFNAGIFNTAQSLSQLGQFYADAIVASKIKYDILFGPAYKGIPIISSAGIALYEKHQIDTPFCYNRKEKKHHGEGGDLIGSPLKGRVLVLDDVVSSGITFKESAHLIAQYPTQLVGLVTALDREEIGETQISAMDEIRQNFKIEAISIIKLRHIIEYLRSNLNYGAELNTILSYQKKYGSYSES